MTIKEFTNKTFNEASNYFRKVHPGRLGTCGSEKYEDLCKTFSFSDSVWTTQINSELTKGGTENMTIEVTDKWLVTKLRYIIKIRYNSEISINYHLGNTVNGITLKEISFQGIGNYFEDTIPELSGIGLNKKVTVRIPLVENRNGRKGTVSEMLQKHFGILKLKLDVAVQEMSDYLHSGKFVETWKSCIETTDKDPNKSSYSYHNNIPELTGILGNHFTSLIADPTGFSLKEMVSYLKYISGRLSDFYPMRRTLLYFGAPSYYCKPYRMEYAANFSGLPADAADEIKTLAKKVDSYRALDNDLNLMMDALQVAYNDIISKELLVSGKTSKELENLMHYNIYKNISYSDLA